MKAIDSALLATYRSSGPTIAVCSTITRTDGTSFRWVGLDRDVVIGGQVYESAPGVELSSLVSTEGFGVDNAEIKVLDVGAEIRRSDLLAGVWDNAVLELAEIDWAAATPVKNVLKRGKLGVFKAQRGYFTAEFRDLRQAMQQAHETVLQATCRYRLGDSRCTKDISGSPFVASGTVDSIQSQLGITDAARTEAADWWGEGIFRFTSGQNAGLSQKIKAFHDGIFLFWAQFVFPIAVGDTYTVTAGCRLRFQEDCITKFANGINFGGEPNKPNPDTLTAPGS